MHRILEARPLSGYRVWLRFTDGVEGEIDLADLAGQGVFSAWAAPGFFAQLCVDPVTHTLSWPGGIDLCADALYDDVVSASGALRDISGSPPKVNSSAT